MGLFKKKASKKETKKVPSKKVSKSATAKKTTKKTTSKSASKKVKQEVVVKKTASKKAKVVVPVKEKESKRVYHVSKRSDGKWAVKFAGGDKVIKLFDTQEEAKKYSNKMAKNQDGVVLVHNSKGKNKGRIQ